MTNAKHWEIAPLEVTRFCRKYFANGCAALSVRPYKYFLIVRDSFVGTPSRSRVLVYVAYMDGTDACVTLVPDTRVR